MNEQAPGWYPDPAGENQQRYWDGDSWTEYYRPLLPSAQEPSGPQAAHEDYPYLESVTHRRPDVMVTPGTPGAASAWGVPDEGRTSGGTKVFGNGVRSTPGGVAAVASLTVLAVLLVTGIGWWALSGRREPDGPGPTSGPSATAGAVTTGTVVPGEDTVAEVSAGGRWEGDLTLDEPVVLMLDVRTESSAEDLEVAVEDSAGDVIGGGDDRGRELAEELGGSSLDPFISVALDAGEYTVVVTELDGFQSDFTVTATEVATEVLLGMPAPVSVPSGGYWVGAVELPEAGEYGVDVRDDSSGDPVLITLASDGRVRSNDDRDPGADDRDPLLETDFPAGSLVLIVTEWSGDATEVTVTVSAL